MANQAIRENSRSNTESRHPRAAVDSVRPVSVVHETGDDRKRRVDAAIARVVGDHTDLLIALAKR